MSRDILSSLFCKWAKLLSICFVWHNTSYDTHKDVFLCGWDVGHSRPNYTVHKSWLQLEVCCLESGLYLFTNHASGQLVNHEGGRGITARRTPLYGSGSFYTFCCITLPDQVQTTSFSLHDLNQQTHPAAVIWSSAYNFDACLKYTQNVLTWV